MNAKAGGWRFGEEQDIGELSEFHIILIKLKGKNGLYSGEAWPTPLDQVIEEIMMGK